MKFTLIHESNHHERQEIEINTLEELKQLVNNGIYTKPALTINFNYNELIINVIR